MKAIILTAWKWTRLKPLTNTTPKPLIEIVWKSILEYNLECVYNEVNEIFIVVKYLKEQIIKEFWDSYKKTKITYINQPDEEWTAASLWNIRTNDDILILYWDSILGKDDIKKVIKFKGNANLVKEVSNPEKYWIYELDKNWLAKKIVEKPKKNIWNLANLGGFKLNPKILNLAREVKISPRWEYELTSAINEFLKDNKIELIKTKWEFIDIWYPWNILDANTYFLKRLKSSKVKWKVEKWVCINWNIILEKWAVLKSGTYIEWNVYIWKNSEIWPNAYLRWETCIWDNCKIWNNVEIKNSSIWNHTKVAHLSYIWDSIIWNNVNIGGWFISANLRHDKANIKAMIKWKLVDTWKEKFGVIIWDNVKTGIRTSTMPWRIIENGSFTTPWEVLK
jgi:bifunctional UDP-N-acetylglucosamine pyrophosphorylase/glucosamine-1-phosphate N-acetyltransferase